MNMVNNYLHFSNGTLNIKIHGLGGIEKALNRIADELEKSNNQNGKHFLLEKGAEE